VKDLGAVAALAALFLAFPTWVTVHVALAGRLLLRSGTRWRGLLSLLVPPLAPMYGFREGFRRSSALWLVALIVYVLALFIARA
jgi:hypothetical protein